MRLHPTCPTRATRTRLVGLIERGEGWRRDREQVRRIPSAGTTGRNGMGTVRATAAPCHAAPHDRDGVTADVHLPDVHPIEAQQPRECGRDAHGLTSLKVHGFKHRGTYEAARARPLNRRHPPPPAPQTGVRPRPCSWPSTSMSGGPSLGAPSRCRRMAPEIDHSGDRGWCMRRGRIRLPVALDELCFSRRVLRLSGMA